MQGLYGCRLWPLRFFSSLGSPAWPASHLGPHGVYQGHTEVSLSFEYRYRRLSQPERSLTLKMKNLSFMALRFEKWKRHVGSNYSAAAPRNFNIPGAPACQLDANLTQLPSSGVAPDLPRRKQKMELGLLPARGREGECCRAGSPGGWVLCGVQRGLPPGCSPPGRSPPGPGGRRFCSVAAWAGAALPPATLPCSRQFLLGKGFSGAKAMGTGWGSPSRQGPPRVSQGLGCLSYQGQR